jgi:hypothetical protein
MSDIAHRFFKDQTSQVGDGSIEDSLLFFIENYNDFLMMYRVMDKQVKKTKEKQELAHKQLQELRDRLAKMKKKKQSLTEAQKIEIDARKEYLTKIREEKDVVYYNGEPIPPDKVTKILIKYRPLFVLFERADKNFRNVIAVNGQKLLSFALKPFIKMIKSHISCIKDSEIKEAFKDMASLVGDIPNDFEETIRSKIEIDLDMHIPRQKQFNWE